MATSDQARCIRRGEQPITLIYQGPHSSTAIQPPHAVVTSPPSPYPGVVPCAMSSQQSSPERTAFQTPNPPRTLGSAAVTGGIMPPHVGKGHFAILIPLHGSVSFYILLFLGLLSSPTPSNQLSIFISPLLVSPSLRSLSVNFVATCIYSTMF